MLLLLRFHAERRRTRGVAPPRSTELVVRGLAIFAIGPTAAIDSYEVIGLQKTV